MAMSVQGIADISGLATSNGDNSSHESNERQIEQVRDILFGEMQKATSERIEALESRMATLEGAVAGRLDEIEKVIKELEASTESAYREKIMHLGKAIAELSDKVMKSAESSVAVVRTDDDKNP